MAERPTAATWRAWQSDSAFYATFQGLLTGEQINAGLAMTVAADTREDLERAVVEQNRRMADWLSAH